MKFLAAILTFYFVLLMGASSIRVIKSQISGQCKITAPKGCCKSEEMPESCQKQKCILNLNFSAGQFLVQQIQSVSVPLIFESEKKENLIYEGTLIENFYNSFWHPPENNFS